MPQTHYRACHLCEAICGLVIETQGEEILSIKGDKNDPLSRGHICPKAVALRDIHEDPDRLRHPVKKVGDEWQQISWEEALDTTAQALAETIERHGVDGSGRVPGQPVGAQLRHDDPPGQLVSPHSHQQPLLRHQRGPTSPPSGCAVAIRA